MTYDDAMRRERHMWCKREYARVMRERAWHAYWVLVMFMNCR